MTTYITNPTTGWAFYTSDPSIRHYVNNQTSFQIKSTNYNGPKTPIHYIVY